MRIGKQLRALLARRVRVDFAGGAAEGPSVCAVAVDVFVLHGAGNHKNPTLAGERIHGKVTDEVRTKVSSICNLAVPVCAERQLAYERCLGIRSVSWQLVSMVEPVPFNLAAEHREIFLENLLARGLCRGGQFRREADRAAGQQRGDQRELDERDSGRSLRLLHYRFPSDEQPASAQRRESVFPESTFRAESVKPP